jgi:energy-coupling factor transporter ATP-binding protein EcfA2
VLREQLAARLAADAGGAEIRTLVLAALDGGDALEALLTDGALPEPADAGGSGAEPLGAYVTSLSVEGFRGVGPVAALELNPGPGLTLVIGRNGSGKSSFAEALEMLFTGDSRRWATRSAVWKEGWRNLHHPTAAIEATLAVERLPGSTVVRREWAEGAELAGGVVTVQPHGEKRTDLGHLGWQEALVTYRPFLSYNELGSMFDEGPTKLHDAVSVVLGLEELPLAEKALKDARLAREKAFKAVLLRRDELSAQLAELGDERARQAVAALQGRVLGLDALESLVTAPSAPGGTDELAALNAVCGVGFPSEAEIGELAAEIREARAELAELAGTEADRLLQTAGLLEQAVAFRERFDAGDCPVCGAAGALDERWLAGARESVVRQKEAAFEARRATARLEAGLRRARELASAVPQAVRDARPLLDVAALLAAWADWLSAAATADPDLLAERLPGTAAGARGALHELQARARAEIDRRQDEWRPLALQLARWLPETRSAQDGMTVVADLKKAEAWLKAHAVAIRNERFAPIADEAMELWTLLRQRSNVRLGRIQLEGAGVQRRVTLDVTVDGVAGAALGVMSQGELHSLALSLFFPRATLDESPFRFVVVDDPVQSMDPAKVDGLARVLERAARKRQVVVFTHDDRLPEAVRRLGIDATTMEVTRGEGSRVEVRPALTPVERHLEDARAIVRTEELPPSVTARVVPAFCRLAFDAACIEAVRRRRIGRGEAHAAVEELLAGVNRTTVLAALALFDDGDRGGDVLGTISGRFGRRSADTFQRVNKGVHAGDAGDLRDLVRDAAVLARSLEACA